MVKSLLMPLELLKREDTSPAANMQPKLCVMEQHALSLHALCKVPLSRWQFILQANLALTELNRDAGYFDVDVMASWLEHIADWSVTYFHEGDHEEQVPDGTL